MADVYVLLKCKNFNFFGFRLRWGCVLFVLLSTKNNSSQKIPKEMSENNPPPVFPANISANALSYNITFNVYIDGQWQEELYSNLPADTNEGPAIYIPLIEAEQLSDPEVWQNNHTQATVNYEGNPPDQTLPNLFIVSTGEVMGVPQVFIATQIDGSDLIHMEILENHPFPHIETLGLAAFESDGIWIAGAIDDGSP